jgi:hypothetical protein
MKFYVLIIWGLFSAHELFAASSYSSSNNDVFVVPGDAALGAANLTFSRAVTGECNPGNLALDSNSEVILAYAGYYLNTFSTAVASFSTAINKNSGLGFSINYLNVPNIENTNYLQTDVTSTGDTIPIYDPVQIKMVSSSDIIVNVSYGYNFFLANGVNVGVGGLLHGLRRRLPTATSEVVGYGVGLNAGAVVTFKQAGVRLALLVRDLTTSYTYWSGSFAENSLPKLHAGIGWRKDIPYVYGRFMVVYQSPDLLGHSGVSLSYDQDLDTVNVVEGASFSENPLFFVTAGHYGLEYLIRNVVAIRAGFHSGKVSFGGGISPINSLSFDFSYAISDLPGTYAVSMMYRW